jgi:hypothetical protein
MKRVRLDCHHFLLYQKLVGHPCAWFIDGFYVNFALLAIDSSCEVQLLTSDISCSNKKQWLIEDDDFALKNPTSKRRSDTFP